MFFLLGILLVWFFYIIPKGGALGSLFMWFSILHHYTSTIFLAEKVDELNLKNVMIIDNSDEKIAKTIINNTKNKNQKILRLNSMQSVGKKELEAGQTYLKIMESNLDVLKEALQ